jgi:hypothetical protein
MAGVNMDVPATRYGLNLFYGYHAFPGLKELNLLQKFRFDLEKDWLDIKLGMEIGFPVCSCDTYQA